MAFSGQDGSGSGVYGKILALDGLVTASAKSGTAVGRVKVDDPDFGDEHTYLLTDSADGRFAIDSSTGVISVANASRIDYDDATSHEISVQVTDSTGNTFTQTLTVDVAPTSHAPTGISLDMVQGEEFALHTYTTQGQVNLR